MAWKDKKQSISSTPKVIQLETRQWTVKNVTEQ